MKRAVVLYLDYNYALLKQFACFYTSYKHINCSHDTDLVVFGPKASLDLVPNDCIKIELDPLDGIWENYRFMNSFHCIISDKSKFLLEYDYLLRSDVDTFLTPAWNSFYPNVYTVGQGEYCFTEDVKNKLKQVAAKFKLRHKGIHNIGSTHYGTASQVRKVCQLSKEIALYLLKEEFTNYEGVWPGWFRGVTLLYSADIAVNHLIDDFEIKPDQLDFKSTSTDSYFNHPHIHCWWTYDLFSKFEYNYGKYNSVVPDLNSFEVRQYCLRMSLEANKNLPWL